ncbi:MAG: hypothetical protein HW421_364 [Ignavibacteria bacterium]|nr:hypothetical protein [Ignavibacteria bacterium]
MEAAELIKKVRKIEIRTRRISNQIFSGEYHSSFKGRGMAFSEVRQYEPGDDIRAIDWNVTARLNSPYIKIFQEERELTVMLLVDVSGSNLFGTQLQFKKDLITELCAVLSFAALQNNDKIGVIFFSDKIEKFIPPKKGRSHVLRIIRELIEFTPESKMTNITEALRYLTNVIKKRSIAFILSDFISEGFSDAVKITSKKHDTIAVQIYDNRETDMPDLGIIRVEDAESGSSRWIDSSDRKFRENYFKWWENQQKSINEIFLKSNVDVIRIRTDESYVMPLMNFFKRREKRR